MNGSKWGMSERKRKNSCRGRKIKKVRQAKEGADADWMTACPTLLFLPLKTDTHSFLPRYTWSKTWSAILPWWLMRLQLRRTQMMLLAKSVNGLSLILHQCQHTVPLAAPVAPITCIDWLRCWNYYPRESLLYDSAFSSIAYLVMGFLLYFMRYMLLPNGE